MDSTLFLLMCFMCVFSTNPDFKRAKDCYVSVGYNIDYQGSMNRTETGRPCSNWKATTWASSDFDGTMDNNYCRNPDKDVKGPWCIVKGGTREYCSIPKCASSAMFDGTGNIDHQFVMNSTTSDTISLAFYTNEEWQKEATILAVKSWRAGLLEIKMLSNVNAGTKDIIQLQWLFERNKASVSLSSRPNQANGDLVRVDVIREGRNLRMYVNDEFYSYTINEDISSDGIFTEPGNIFIGKSPYGNEGFRGCVADVSYNNVRPLDMAMGSRPKGDDEMIMISSGVWEGCLLVPPSDWEQPAVLPTQMSNEVEPNEQQVKLKVSNATYDSHSASTYSSLASSLLVAIFLILQFG